MESLKNYATKCWLSSSTSLNCLQKKKNQCFTTNFTKQVKLVNFYVKTEGQEKVSTWSETFSQPWNPIEDTSHLLPENPPGYNLFVIFSLLLGLGLDKDYLQTELGEKSTVRAQANYYPPCPEPELTLGLVVHTDLNALKVLRQFSRSYWPPSDQRREMDSG
ncbi:Oxoglutarate/iron-dependent dioxygenase [Melia azedarach]|uniref:Oxoglutarate/iron-dependent dioxygenase n=1 Tax=Melia azedarach TaxID=155640 RepID=A0ACC1XI19_MELAZ|nr:Oxoglutarate/iron-dependent dioxygenase [Melia azedarach]